MENKCESCVNLCDPSGLRPKGKFCNVSRGRVYVAEPQQGCFTGKFQPRVCEGVSQANTAGVTA